MLTIDVENLEAEYQTSINKINVEVSRFTSILALVFDGTENQKFEASITLARNEGIAEEKIIKSVAERDAFFITE